MNLFIVVLLLSVVWSVPAELADTKSFLSRGEKCGGGEGGLKLKCDHRIGLECSKGMCDCKPGFTISRNGTHCLEIARKGLESPCEESIQCWKSLLGRLSECNIGTNKCSCYESDTQPIVFHQGRCYYGESLGDYCQIDGLCSATTVNAVCKSGICQCREGYVASWDKSRCLPIATQGLNSSCEENIQCEKSPLGALSECNQDRMQCECYQIPMVPTVFHQARCYFGAGLGDVCQVLPQCTSKVPNSVCGKDGKCRCQDGYLANDIQTACEALPAEVPADGAEAWPECRDNGQCQGYGHFSRCNTTTGKCECYNPDTAAVIKERGNHTGNNNGTRGTKCYSTKYLGQSCKFHKQCSLVTENAVCMKGQCACNESSHASSQDRRKCLEIAISGLESFCDEDIQCTRSPLGPLSICNPVTNKCQCTAEFPVVYHQPRCYFLRQLGATCESDLECRESENSLAECRRGRCDCGGNSTLSTDQGCVLNTERIFASTVAGAAWSINIGCFLLWMLLLLQILILSCSRSI